MTQPAKDPAAKRERQERTHRRADGVKVSQVWELVEETPLSAEDALEEAAREAVSMFHQEIFEKHHGERDHLADFAAFLVNRLRPYLKDQPPAATP